MIILSFWVISLIGLANSANILILHPLDIKNHVSYLQPLAVGLAERNHTVTVVTSDITSFNDGKINVIRVRDANFTTMKWENSNKNFMSDIVRAHEFTSINIPVFLRSREMRELFASNSTFDAVISNTLQFYQSICVVPHHFKALAIDFLPQGNLLFSSMYTGTLINSNDGYNPNESLLWNFMQRAQKTLQTTVALLYYRCVVLPRHEQIVREAYGPLVTPLTQLLYEKSLILANGHPSLTTPKYISLLQKNVAGISIRPQYSVPEEYEAFINKSASGFIVVSWGSIISSCAGATGDTILDALSRIPQQIIWKCSRTNFSRRVPENFMISKWIPQSSLLGDKRIKLFWTHGGFSGMVETVYNGVPVIVTPTSLDQPLNANHMVSSGFGLLMGRDNITVNSLISTANEIMRNPKYQLAATKASEEFRSRLVPPKDEAIFWIERAIRFKDRIPRRMSFVILYVFVLENIDVFILTLCALGITLFCLQGLVRSVLIKIFHLVSRSYKLKYL